MSHAAIGTRPLATWLDKGVRCAVWRQVLKRIDAAVPTATEVIGAVVGAAVSAYGDSTGEMEYGGAERHVRPSSAVMLIAALATSAAAWNSPADAAEMFRWSNGNGFADTPFASAQLRCSFPNFSGLNPVVALFQVQTYAGSFVCTNVEGTSCAGGYGQIPSPYTENCGQVLQKHRSCDDGVSWFPVDASTPPCSAGPDPGKNAGPPYCGVGNPINPGYGNKYQEEVDYVGPGPFPLRLVRTYNSTGFIPVAQTGIGWRTNYDRGLVLTALSDKAIVQMLRPDGRTLKFWLWKNGVSVPLTPYDSGALWVADADIFDVLKRQVDGSGNTTGWTYYVAATEETETYSAAGKLSTIANRAGLTHTLTYDTYGQLVTVTDSFGRTLTLTYDSKARIATMHDPADGLYQYAYDEQDPANPAWNLSSISYPDLSVRRYWYNEPAFTQNADLPNALTGISDELGQRFATFSYDSARNAVSTEHAGGVEKYSVAYDFVNGTSVVTDPLLTTRTYSFATVLGVIKSTGLSQPCPTCGGTNASGITYDGNGNVASRTDFKGNKTCYAYEPSRNLETARVEGLLSSETCSTALATPPHRPDVRKVTMTWNANFRLPETITEPVAGGARTTTFTYDASGNLTQKVITGPKNDGSGGTLTRTWNWTYGTLGRITQATDPSADATTYTYYADNQTEPVGKRGSAHTVTNAAGHVTEITAYDAHGRPLTIIDPNDVTTQLVYHSRGWLTSRTVGGEQTQYGYDDTGQLIRVTAPDLSYVDYDYDGAHRLTEIRDSLGNRIVYILDNMGNRTGEDVYDHEDVLTRTRSRVYNSLNQLWKDIGALDQATTYTYDNNGNRSTATDPLARQTINGYDALNRLLSVTDPGTGVTGYAYDPAGNLQSVTDPRTLTTTYTYDATGALVSQQSPDTGTTTQTYDAGGRLATRLDARGVTATYTYDALNRVTQIAFSQSGPPTETHQFAYDSGTYGKGRLTSISDATGTTSWTYTPHGRVATKTQAVTGAPTQSVTYGYSAGQLDSLTTPSGQVIGYSYLNNRIVGITVNGSSLAAGVVTTPFGPVGAWQWGNGLVSFRDYDTDGRVTSWEFRNGTSVLRNNLTWDNASRITAIADPANAAISSTYPEYDALDRLKKAQKGNPVSSTQEFDYDAVGNRTSATVNSLPATLTYSGTSNRLSTLGGAMDLDPLRGDMSRGYTYNLANRLVAVSRNGSPVATYQLSALGQRIAKTAGGVTTRFVYDEQGRLLGEYQADGKLIQETVWLEDLPIATLRPQPGSGSTPVAIDIYYVHADHLGTPRAITRPSDNAFVWRWDNVDAFGANPANEDPSGAGAFSFTLRFPGQYYDAETGTHYNYFRDYDPTIGRYEQSDPIGLRGGANTYAYALSDPLLRSDSMGLDAWRGDVPVAFLCSRPLANTGTLGSLAYGMTDAAGHSFLCLSTGNCYGQGPASGNPFVTGPGHDPGDTWATPRACSPVPKPSPCLAQCVEDEGRKPRPNYRYPGASSSQGGAPIDCRTWANEVISTCRQRCGG